MPQQQTPSTPSTSQLRKPAQTAGWYPQLQQTGLSPQAQNAITMVYQLLYSQRDSANQMQNALTTLTGYGTHLQRTNFTELSTQALGVQLGSLYYETDRSQAVYQCRINPASAQQEWFIAGGIYVDVLANRPTDLIASPGTNDIGFLFLSADQSPNHLYRWDSKTWVQLL